MTHIIYISDWLEKSYKPVYEQLIEALAELKITPKKLPYSEDVWCRDFMPVHIGGGKYVGFRYNPDYLVEDDALEKTITKQELAIEELDINFSAKLKLVLDGGNYVRCGDKVVMTDKIFFENYKLRSVALLNQLEKAFQAEIILLPWDMEEEYGHADGMVAWLDEDRVLLNNYRQLEKGKKKTFTKRLRKILDHHFDIVELEYGIKPSEDSWCYLNYLETDNAILLPTLSENQDCKDDQEALSLFHDIFKDKDIKPVYAKPLINEGGALHCATWEHYIP